MIKKGASPRESTPKRIRACYCGREIGSVKTPVGVRSVNMDNYELHTCRYAIPLTGLRLVP